MDNSLDLATVKNDYLKMSDTDLKSEYEKIIAIPDARTNIEALTKMSILLPILEDRGIIRKNNSSSHANHDSDGPSWGLAILGILLIVGGIAASAFTDRVFYGAVIVGAGMLIKSFI